MTIYKIIGIAILSVVICILFKKLKEEYALFISILVSILILLASLSTVVPIFEYLKNLSGDLGFNTYIEIILKSCAVGIISSFASDIAKDSGESAIANKIELLGKCTILFYALPIVKTLISSALEFI